MDHVRIIATVNVHSETSRAKMKAWFERWQAERKRRKDAGEPQMVPYRTLDVRLPFVCVNEQPLMAVAVLVKR